MQPVTIRPDGVVAGQVAARSRMMHVPLPPIALPRSVSAPDSTNDIPALAQLRLPVWYSAGAELRHTINRTNSFTFSSLSESGTGSSARLPLTGKRRASPDVSGRARFRTLRHPRSRRSALDRLLNDFKIVIFIMTRATLYLYTDKQTHGRNGAQFYQIAHHPNFQVTTACLILVGLLQFK